MAALTGEREPLVDDALGAALKSAKGRLFAVVDAAQVDFLQDELSLARLKFEPLYLDEIDAPSIASGPHLVTIRNDHDIAVVRSIIGEASACVWWVWSDEQSAPESIYRHLRGLNMVEIPRDRDDQSVGNARDPGFETVLFRHADPNVVISILPILYEEQVVRFFGDAVAVIVESTDYGAIRTFDAPKQTSARARGMLRLGERQYATFVNSDEYLATFKVIEGLEDSFPEYTSNFSEEDLFRLVRTSEESAASIGLVSEEAYFHWACLCLLTNGEMANVPDLKSSISEADAFPDEVIEQTLLEMRRLLETTEG